MNAVTEKKPRLTTSAMIASIASEGQRVQAAPFGKALVKYAADRPEIVGMTADLGKYTDMHLFAQAYPERFFQMGMAEQLLMAAAGGMAKEGLIPFATTYAVFGTRRAYDFIRMAAISDAGISAVAGGGTVATLLPATMLFLGTGHQAPARRLIEAGAAVALASDFNPGTSPLQAFPLVLTLAVSELRLSAAEAWIAATVNGAAALGLAGSTGQLSPGFSADIAVHEVDDYRALPYRFGERLCRVAWARGRPCFQKP